MKGLEKIKGCCLWQIFGLPNTASTASTVSTRGAAPQRSAAGWKCFGMCHVPLAVCRATAATWRAKRVVERLCQQHVADDHVRQPPSRPRLGRTASELKELARLGRCDGSDTLDLSVKFCILMILMGFSDVSFVCVLHTLL